MTGGISLGRWFGVPVRLHYSWFVIAWLITLSLTARFASLNPAWSTGLVWILALVTAALFFVSIVLHELSHAAAARVKGVPVRDITLFALGGIARIEKEAATPGSEFQIAAAGPAASLGIGLGCRGLSIVAGLNAGPAVSPAAAVLDWLAYINVMLALFNLIPAFPLDGGRVLRSAIWAGTHDADKATRLSARVGQVIAFAFIIGGLFVFLRGGNFGGLWIGFIGWFLLEGARSSYRQTEFARSLKDLRVGDIMARECTTVEARTTLREFVDDHLLRRASGCVAVSERGRIVGLITAADVKHLPPERWPVTTIAEVMRPIGSLPPLTPDASARDALDVMGRENVNQLPVVWEGRLHGVVTRSYLVHLLQVRRELGA